jgi:hypothetical protein
MHPLPSGYNALGDDSLGTPLSGWTTVLQSAEKSSDQSQFSSRTPSEQASPHSYDFLDDLLGYFAQSPTAH